MNKYYWTIGLLYTQLLSIIPPCWNLLDRVKIDKYLACMLGKATTHIRHLALRFGFLSRLNQVINKQIKRDQDQASIRTENALTPHAFILSHASTKFTFHWTVYDHPCMAFILNQKLITQFLAWLSRFEAKRKRSKQNNFSSFSKLIGPCIHAITCLFFIPLIRLLLDHNG